jgi:predicted Mrr-cat superfamily restriction endonuclease
MIRAGRYGEQEDTALRKGVVTIDWKEMPNLSGIKTQKGIQERKRISIRRGHGSSRS